MFFHAYHCQCYDARVGDGNHATHVHVTVLFLDHADGGHVEALETIQACFINPVSVNILRERERERGRGRGHTLHDDLRVVGDSGLGKRTLRQPGLAKDIELDSLVVYDGLGVIRERLRARKHELMLDVGNDAIGGLHGGHLQDGKGLVAALERKLGLEGVQGWVELALGADGLLDFKLQPVWAGVGDHHLRDGEGGVVDRILGHLGICDIDAARKFGQLSPFCLDALRRESAYHCGQDVHRQDNDQDDDDEGNHVDPPEPLAMGAESGHAASLGGCFGSIFDALRLICY